MSHPSGPGHTSCAWADAARFVEGPEWPRNADGTTRTLRAPDFRIGHEGPWAVVNVRDRPPLQTYCRVCRYVCIVDYKGDPVGASWNEPICSMVCVRRFMGYLMDTSGPTTEDIVTGRA